MVSMKKLVKQLLIFIIAGVLSAFCLGRLETAYTYPGHSDLLKSRQDVLVVPPGAPDRPAYYATGNLYTFLATGEETDDAFSLFDFFVPLQSVALPHIHSREDEAFYVLEGEVTFQLASQTGIQTKVATPGSLVFLPKNRPHGWLNTGTTPARLLSLIVPSGFEGFFVDQNQPVINKSDPIPPPLSPEALGPIAQKYGVRPVLTSDFVETDTREGLLNYLVVTPDTTSPSFNVLGNRFTLLANSEQTGGQFSLIEVSLLPQVKLGLLRLLQSDEREAHSFYILEGEVKFRVGNKSLTAAPGTFIYVPKGTPYGFENTETKPARMLSLLTPTTVAQSSAS